MNITTKNNFADFKGAIWKYGMSVLLSCIMVASCQKSSTSDDKDKTDGTEDVALTTGEEAIRITTLGMDFQMPDTIPNGWSTFHYVNESNETHFFVLEKLPDGKTIKDSETEVIPVFQEGMDLINDGKAEESGNAFAKLPEWFSEVVFSGGSGLVSPGGECYTTVHLDPGYYVVECYVKMPTGMFHSAMGMARGLVVSDAPSGMEEPTADIHITLSSTDGIGYDKAVPSGMQTFSVQFHDQIVHENFVGHDLHLVRIGSTDKLFDLEKWMNWADPEGLISPAPEGVEFLGGVNDMPEGQTGYFTADLQPGLHVFVSEVPNAMSKNLLKVFQVD